MKSFNALFSQLEQVAATMPPDSNSARLLAAGAHEIGKKVVEEAAEVWMAAEQLRNLVERKYRYQFIEKGSVSHFSQREKEVTKVSETRTAFSAPNSKDQLSSEDESSSESDSSEEDGVLNMPGISLQEQTTNLQSNTHHTFLWLDLFYYHLKGF